MNLETTSDEVATILTFVKKMGEEKKSSITDEEFLTIYSNVKTPKL